MPVFDYQCEKCKTRYDVYHKLKEVQDDILCPSCGSKAHKKLMSVPAAPVIAKGNGMCSESSCDSGGCGCGGGSCSLN